VTAGDPRVHRGHLDPRLLLGIGDRLLDRFDRRLDVDDDAAPQSARRRRAEPDDVEPTAGPRRRDDGADLRGPDIQPDDELLRLRALYGFPPRPSTT
jgi:hypothetical protein